jgi:hypothetical protein
MIEAWLPRSLHSVAGAPDYGAQEKAGHSGRDDRIGKQLEGEDLEVALAGEDYAQEAAVGGEGVFADGEAVEEHAGFGFEDGDFRVRRVGAEFGDAEGDEVGGFFFDGAFEIDL